MLVIAAPAGHVTVATVPKLLPVPHAVDSTDDDCDRDAVRDADDVTLPPNDCERDLVAATDRLWDGDREREALPEGETAAAAREAEREALVDGDISPARDAERERAR